jgi:hypothetical protein
VFQRLNDERLCRQDYACPFCKTFYNTFTSEVSPHYGDRLKLVVYHQVQPWHPQSTMLHEAALAVTKVGGEEAFWKFSKALFETQTDFFDANTYNKSRAAIYQVRGGCHRRQSSTSPLVSFMVYRCVGVHTDGTLVWSLSNCSLLTH